MQYPRNIWYVAAWSHELETAKPMAVRLLDDRIALFRTEGGKLAALEDRCVHRLAPLSLGRCEGEKLRCMYHGILFDTDGSIAHIPGQDLIPAQARVRSYPVAERHGWVWVWPGDPAKADENLIPECVGVGHPDYYLGHGHLDYAAEASLINDNLLDFSHIAYVHEKSFKLGDEMAETHAEISTLDNGILYVRWIENLCHNAAGDPDEPGDFYMRYEYIVPGILLMVNATFPPGTAKRLNFGTPDVKDAIRDVTYTSQAVTPTGHQQMRYFFTYGPHRDFATPDMVEPMVDVVRMAFAEDKRMIEAQQQVINDTPDPRMIPISHDRSITIFNRMMEKMIRAENGEIAETAAA